MTRYKVNWNYAMQARDPITRQAIDPRRSGGEYVYEADSKESALKRLETDLSSKEWTQPFDATLLKASAYELLGASNYERNGIIKVLQTLSADELARLLTDAADQPPPPATAQADDAAGG